MSGDTDKRADAIALAHEEARASLEQTKELLKKVERLIEECRPVQNQSKL